MSTRCWARRARRPFTLDQGRNAHSREQRQAERRLHRHRAGRPLSAAASDHAPVVERRWSVVRGRRRAARGPEPGLAPRPERDTGAATGVGTGGADARGTVVAHDSRAGRRRVRHDDRVRRPRRPAALPRSCDPVGLRLADRPDAGDDLPLPVVAWRQRPLPGADTPFTTAAAPPPTATPTRLRRRRPTPARRSRRCSTRSSRRTARAWSRSASASARQVAPAGSARLRILGRRSKPIAEGLLTVRAEPHGHEDDPADQARPQADPAREDEDRHARAAPARRAEGQEDAQAGAREALASRAASARSSARAGRSRAARARSGRRRRGSPRRRATSAPAVTTNGTGLSEWAVSGEPSSSSISSALPWSAVTRHAPPLAWTASTTRPRHSSTVSTAVTAASITPGVPDHVGVREVDDREGEVLLLPVPQERLGRLARAHLGLVVVGRDVARRRRQLAHLALVRLLLPAVEEVRHVRVLLGLGDVELRAALARDDRPDGDRRPLRREGDRERPVLVVLGQRRVAVDDLAELRRDLAHPVGPEVEGEDGVAGPDPRLLPDRRGGDELVGLVALVGVLAPPARRCRRGAARSPRRAGRRPARSGPSAGRGPSRSSGRSPTRSARCPARGRSPRSPRPTPRPRSATCRGRR